MATAPQPGNVDPRARARALMKASSTFGACPDATIDEIVRRAQLQKFAKGESLCHQGDPGDSLMIVLSGSLKVTNITADAKEVVLDFLKAGALIGEIAALDGRERTANVVALEPTETVVIFRRDLMPVLRQSNEAMFALLEGLCARIRATNALVESFSRGTDVRVAACLVRLIEEHGQDAQGGKTIDLKLTQRDLGSHLGLTRETVSRTLSDFRDHGLVEVRGTSIVVLDVDGLRDIAEGE